MKHPNGYSLHRKAAGPFWLLSSVFLLRGLHRYNAAALLLGVACLLCFPVALVHASPVLYVSNQSSNTVSVIDGTTYALLHTIPVGQEPYGVGISPDGKTVFITNLVSDTVSVINADTNKPIALVSFFDSYQYLSGAFKTLAFPPS